jgi:tetratricopeptide (TPR) repeat protein
MYIPVAGLCLVAGEFFAHVYMRWSARKLLCMGGCVILVSLAALTVKRSLQWKDDVSLFASAVRADPLSVEGYFNLGNALMDVGNLSAAKLEWEKALQVDPAHSGALSQIGTLLATQGSLREAERYYNAALRSNSKNTMAHYNLGKIYEMEGNLFKAIEHYELSLKHMDILYAEYTQEIGSRLAQLRKKTVEYNRK